MVLKRHWSSVTFPEPFRISSDSSTDAHLAALLHFFWNARQCSQSLLTNVHTFPLGAGYSQRVPHWRCQPEGQQPHEEIIKVLRPFFLLQLHPLIYVSVWFPSSHMQWCHFVIGRWCLNDACCDCVITQCICSFSGNPCSHCAPALGALMRPWGNLGSCSSSSSSRESTVNKILTPNKCGFRRLNLRNHNKEKKQNKHYCLFCNGS